MLYPYLISQDKIECKEEKGLSESYVRLSVLLGNIGNIDLASYTQ